MTTRTTRKGRRLTGRAGFLLVIVFVLAALATFPLREYWTQRGEVRRLERQVEELLENQRQLNVEVEQARDPDYLERLARECLGMVLPGETAFVAVPPGGEAEDTPC